MDIATLLGILLGSGLVIGAIMMGGQATLFVNIPGLLIVLGGSFSVLFVKFPMKTVLLTLKVKRSRTWKH